MRHDQRRRLVDHRVTVENQIEIECPSGTRIRTPPAELLLDFKQQLEQRSRAERGLPGQRSVQKRGLIGIDADRRGVAKAREVDVVNEGREGCRGIAQQLLTIAQIAAKSDGNGGGLHNAQGSMLNAQHLSPDSQRRLWAL